MMSNIKIADPCNGHEGKFSWIWIEPKSCWPLLTTYLNQQLSFFGFAMHRPSKDVSKVEVSLSYTKTMLKRWKRHRVIFLGRQACSADIFGHFHTARLTKSS
jgi:hypothetical protein